MKQLLFGCVLVLGVVASCAIDLSSSVSAQVAPVPSGCKTDVSGLIICPGSGNGGTIIVGGNCTSPSPVASPTGGVAINYTCPTPGAAVIVSSPVPIATSTDLPAFNTLNGYNTVGFVLSGSGSATVTGYGSADGGNTYGTVGSAESSNGTYAFPAVVTGSGGAAMTNFYVAVSSVTGTVNVSQFAGVQLALYQPSGGASGFIQLFPSPPASNQPGYAAIGGSLAIDGSPAQAQGLSCGYNDPGGMGCLFNSAVDNTSGETEEFTFQAAPDEGCVDDNEQFFQGLNSNGATVFDSDCFGDVALPNNSYLLIGGPTVDQGSGFAGLLFGSAYGSGGTFSYITTDGGASINGISGEVLAAGNFVSNPVPSPTPLLTLNHLGIVATAGGFVTTATGNTGAASCTISATDCTTSAISPNIATSKCIGSWDKDDTTVSDATLGPILYSVTNKEFTLYATGTGTAEVYYYCP